MSTEKQKRLAKEVREHHKEYEANPSEKAAEKIKDGYQKLVDEFAKEVENDA